MQSGPTSNRKTVCAAPSSIFDPAAPVSEAPKLSRIKTFGSASRNCCRTADVRGAPPFPMLNILERSYLFAGASRSASASGRAIASPTVLMEFALPRSAKAKIACASKRARVYSTSVPPATNALPISHCPPPCIMGPIAIRRIPAGAAAAS